jgi:hypothetical protein
MRTQNLKEEKFQSLKGHLVPRFFKGTACFRPSGASARKKFHPLKKEDSDRWEGGEKWKGVAD